MAKQKKKKTGKTYVLFGCPISLDERYDCQGYVGTLEDGSIGLVDGKANAFQYVDDKKLGHGTPEDWIALFKEDYGLNVHPIFLNS